jgi:hypothetical protein
LYAVLIHIPAPLDVHIFEYNAKEFTHVNVLLITNVTGSPQGFAGVHFTGVSVWYMRMFPELKLLLDTMILV